MGLYSDIFGGGAASQGASRAADLSERAYRDTKPYRRLGTGAVERLSDVYLTGEEDFRASPGYDFRRSEMQKAVDRAMSARGMYGSGARGKALARYADDLATDEYNQEFNRLAALAGVGQTGVSQGMGALGQQGGYELARGQARQSGYDRSSGAAINTLAGLAGMYG